MVREISCLVYQTGQIKNLCGLSCFFLAETLVQRVYQFDRLIDARGSINETVKSEFPGVPDWKRLFPIRVLYS